MSWLLLKNADVYTPEHLGLVDILIVNDKIVRIGEHIEQPVGLSCQVLDAHGRKRGGNTVGVCSAYSRRGL